MSTTGFEGAELNSSEIKGWNFNKVKSEAEKLWDDQLSKIQIDITDKEKATKFYTALYHTMVQPNIAQDLDGKYRGEITKFIQLRGLIIIRYSRFGIPLGQHIRCIL